MHVVLLSLTLLWTRFCLHGKNAEAWLKDLPTLCKISSPRGKGLDFREKNQEGYCFCTWIMHSHITKYMEGHNDAEEEQMTRLCDGHDV